MPTEIELKLRFPQQFAVQIKQLPFLKIFSSTKPIQQNLYSVYYDTPDFILKKNRIALRLRKTDEHWTQTIKSGGTIHDGLHQHHECEYTISGDRPDFSKLSNQKLRYFFSDRTLRQLLRPVFATDFIRTVYLLKPAKGFRLELCIDEGRIITKRLHTDISESICEIELELKSGNITQLFQFSKALQKNSPCPLIPDNKNKAMRGYALLLQKPGSKHQSGESGT
ncbi:CYTH domain-containing protein [Nitrosomonas sp. Nm51]|uniref:CYTH domain-containing protein n=1 Tax=Nitrosomonas sp. Nm51 TaxID=133720 RepID=UPI0008CCC50B|nr:CYTH domain-containing protein [Nitrosomonas sp. Nm51]SER39295.1 CYTH domain-containing protein [Nitrosomonas sp. Nm51]